ncbi:hypothetical protein SDC9_20797 [bioreactor metagenome]|uniref:Cytochrome C biogenesis protein transmembrane domain-containing protein n=1 Tax=bioreactor metagenome TaxID=1076179 RepID=A0A644U7R5_9ZZZZ|nr:cytochrome c biogenesis protein CcdA [Desulfitobacterium hafniense]MEA5024572.1 cytochrome c biogenesis protein CcdA [Desulfitobacterium hafniense]
MESFVNNLSLSLNTGSWGVLLTLFGFGLLESFSPCMGAMLPLVAGSTRTGSYNKTLLFSGGFITSIMLLGLLSAKIGQVLTLSTWFWTSLLGILYLMIGLFLLGIRLPIRISWFYILPKKPNVLSIFINQEGLNPFFLGIIFALAPSPCTTPVVMAVSAFSIASGKLLFSILALGAFGLGHSLVLGLTFLPAVRNLFRSTRVYGYLRTILGITMVLLSVYLLVQHPQFSEVFHE